MDGLAVQRLLFYDYSPQGTVFCKAMDASNALTDATCYLMLFYGIMENIGEQHILQVVTKNNATMKPMCKK